MLKHNLYFYQFFEHILIVLIVLSLFFILKNKKIINLQTNKYLKKFVVFIGGMSLEIYLIHTYFKSYPLSIFPLNILIFVILVLIGSYLFKIFFLSYSNYNNII